MPLSTEVRSHLHLFKEGSAAVMAVTAAPYRQAVAKRGTQAGELAGDRQVETNSPRPF
jgi:hypothetical protein